MGMLDRNTGGANLTNKVLQNLFCTTAAATWSPTGGSSLTVTPPLFLRLMTAVGSATANGTELSGTLGYTTGGSTMGSPAFGNPAAGVLTNSNAVTWSSITGSWTTVTSIEIWDSTATKIRLVWGTLTASITGVASGDTVSFATASISLDGSGF